MNPRFVRFILALAILPCSALTAPAAETTAWQAGVATRKLTPAGPIWLAGYAGRNAPSDGVDQDVFAKAIAIQDASSGRIVIVTLDLIGVPRSLRHFVERTAAAKFGLKPNEVLLNASHTHSGPQVYPDRMALERAFSRHAKPGDVAAVTSSLQVFQSSSPPVVKSSDRFLEDSKTRRLEDLKT